MPSRYKIQAPRCTDTGGGWRLRTQRTVCQIAAAGDTELGTGDTRHLDTDILGHNAHYTAQLGLANSHSQPQMPNRKIVKYSSMVQHDHFLTSHLYLVFTFTLLLIAIDVIRIITLRLPGQSSAYGRLVDTYFNCRYDLCMKHIV